MASKTLKLDKGMVVTFHGDEEPIDIHTIGMDDQDYGAATSVVVAHLLEVFPHLENRTLGQLASLEPMNCENCPEREECHGETVEKGELH